MSFSISQHIRDELLLTKLIDYLGCGNIDKVSTRLNGVTFVVNKFHNIIEKIIPFSKNTLSTELNVWISWIFVKSLNFCKVAELMQSKEHLTAEGLEQIRLIKAGMNKGR